MYCYIYTELRKFHLDRPILSIFILLAIFLSSCQHRQHRLYTDMEEKQVDSIVSACQDLNSLQLILKRYTKEDNKLGMAVAYRELGKYYRENSRFTESIDFLRKGISYAQEIRDTLEIIQGLNNLGTSFRRMGILDEASTYHYQALSYCELYSDKQSKKAKKARVVSLNGIGNVNLTLNNYVVADSIFRVALVGEHELNSSLGQAINYANLGSIFESTGQIDSAWVYYKRSMELNCEAKSDLGIALCYIHYGNLYEKDKKWNEAVDEYKEAYNLMEKSKDSWHWLEACLSLAQVYLKNGESESARGYIDKAKSTAQSIGSLEHMSKACQLNYLWYKQHGDCRKALENYIQSRMFADSVSSKKNMDSMQNLRIKYERERRQNEINLIRHNFQMEQRVRIVVSFIAIAILLLAIAVIVFLWYALRMRANNQRIMRHMEQVRTNFFTNITHEFRTPLTVILGFGKELEKGSLPEGETMENIGRTITRQGSSLLNLINQLLDISKVKSAIGEPDWRKGNIVAYIRMITESYVDGARQKKIDLIFSPAENNVEMDFVPDYIKKILRNLLSNALKFTPQFGKIYITTHKDNDKLVIRVADTGKGIDKDDLPHIFEAFYQGEKNTTEIGTGVGLSLVHQIIESMNGNINVKSNLGKGSVFTITLPLVHGKSQWSTYIEDGMLLPKEEVPNDENIILPKGQQTSDTVPMLLIVEDNTDVSYYIGSQLQEQYNLFYARNGEEGLERAKELMPDLIITDLMMPGMNGYELCRSIRSSEILNHIPIIIITARSTEDDRIKGLEAGADAYLYKPFNSDELNVRLKQLLESRRMLREKYSSALQKGKEEEVQLSKNDQAFLNRLIDVVYAKIANSNTDVESIASAMCMSRSQLNRKIIAITGENTTTYLIQIKLSKAKHLLDSPEDIPIGDIAMQCGFEDGAYFSRIFKQVLNMTPSQYKKRVK
jgi:two-component system sensor histidine kinase ChiS